MAKKQGKKTDQTRTGRVILKRVAWIVAAGVWLLAVVSLLGYDPMDWPNHGVAPHNEQIQNWCGPVGAVLSYQLYYTLGPGVWVLLTGVAALLVMTLRGRMVDQIWLRAIGGLICAVTASGMIALGLPELGSMPEGSGGIVAIWLVDFLTGHLASLGTFLVLLAVFAVGAIVAVDELLLALPSGVRVALKKVAILGRPIPALAGMGGRLLSRKDRDERATKKPKRRRDEVVEPELEDELEDEEEYEYEEELIDDGDEEEWEDEEEDAYDEPDAETAEDEAPMREGVSAEAVREKIKNLPISFAQTQQSKEQLAPIQDLSGYKFPGMDLLEDPESNFTDEMAKSVRDQAEILETALQTYRIDAEVVAIDAGPVITLYEVQLAPGTKVAAVQNIASDVARELKAQNIRIVPNTAGKSTVGIEVPNQKKERVRLKDLMQIGGKKVRDTMRLPMYLGKDASGNPLIADLATMPHMLIAGTTGSGKSVCMNSIIMSLLFCRRPDEVKLVLVDPKMVEMAQFRNIPHLMCPVVTDMGKAAAILEWAVTKMDERYELLADAGVRDINAYNDLGEEELYERMEVETEAERAKVPSKLHRMVFVIDELADLMMTNKDVEHHIVRIAQKARAVGLHLILATQRPQANVVTGLIKSNMPCRICMKVASGMDSRIVLDSKGGELLLGHGDMLYLSPRSAELTRAQGTLVDDIEIRRAVKFLKEVAAQSFEPQLVQLPGAGGRDVDEESIRDPLFEKAVEVVLETQRGSVSLIQRRLTIGYSRASRLVEAMALAGILGSHKNAQAREVMISLDEWEAMKAQLAATEAEGTLYADTVETPSEAEAGGEAKVKAESEAELDVEEDEEGVEEEVEEEEAKEAEAAEPEEEEGEEEEEEDVEYEYVYEDDPEASGEEDADGEYEYEYVEEEVEEEEESA